MKDNTDQTSSVKDFSADDEILTQTNEQEQNNQNANDDELVNFDELKTATQNNDDSAQISELKTKLVQAQADFENIKKRLEKDKITAVNFANESFARDLLPVLDSFKQVLNKHGVRMIQTNEGGEFNPQIHNAMSYIQSQTIASGRIAQIYQHGYMYNDRILRPAMVLISK